MKLLLHALGVEVSTGDETHVGWLPKDAAKPLRTPREPAIFDFRIYSSDGGFILEWVSRDNSIRGDLWFSTITGAVDETFVQWGLSVDSWTEPTRDRET
jgi:hypothetical protein